MHRIAAGVVTYAIGNHWREPMREEKPGRLLKLFAYHYGLSAYERVLAYLLNRGRFDDWLDEAADDNERLERHLTRVLVLGYFVSGLDEDEGRRRLAVQRLTDSKWSLDVALLPPVPGFTLPDSRRGLADQEPSANEPAPPVFAFEDYAAAAPVGPPYPAA